MLAMQMPFPHHHNLFDLVDSLAHPVPTRRHSELHETEDAFHLTVEAPGVQATDVDIALDQGVLRVSGRSTVMHGGLAYSAQVRRAISLPANRIEATQVAATLEHGILHVTVPKKARAAPIKVRIASTSDAKTIEQAPDATHDDAMGDDAGEQ